MPEGRSLLPALGRVVVPAAAGLVAVVGFGRPAGALLPASALAAALTRRGLVVAPEHRCSPYDWRDHPYSQSVEPRIVEVLGGRVYGPYTGRTFASCRRTGIEHVAAVSEAHDSGLCAADASTRRRFAQRVVEVRRKYRLTIDRREADAFERVLSGCKPTKMVFYDDGGAAVSADPPDSRDMSFAAAAALARWDDNRNGRISCKEARRHRIAPVRRGHPAYPFMRDSDGDGVACE